MNKNFNPAEAWNKAMSNNFIDKPADDNMTEAISADTTAEDELKLKRKEQARKTRDALLVKNPNHFKELSAKAHAKKEQK